MKVLIVGSGGREHALAWKVKPDADEVLAAPGNPGISRIGKCFNVRADDIASIARIAEENEVDLTIVGPEAPLVAGIWDEFSRRGLKLFGPSKEAAKLEGSKAFSKEVMREFGVPTADFEVFESPEDAESYVRRKGAPIVVKADGLAAGKGVFVASTVEEAVAAIRKIMVEKAFGDAGKRVVVEEFLEGQEASYLVITDGERFVPLATSQDHKRVFDGDRGPNTGGMGAYSPAPFLSKELELDIQEKIVKPVIDGMRRMGTPFRGVLYAGLMITGDGPKVLEFNVRFGDPEAQAILRRMESSLVELCMSAVEGRLNGSVSWLPETSICVVLASRGYPGRYEKGKVITGIEDAERVDDVVVFHAGTSLKDGKLLTAGGRVLNVTALGRDIADARENVYRAVERIHFEGMHYRKDIGLKALKKI